MLNLRSRTSLAELEILAVKSQVKIPKRPLLRQVCESRMFRMIGVIMSLGVVVQFGIVADYDLEDNDTVADEFFQYLFTIFFIGELLLRMCVYKRTRDFFTETEKWKWNLSDLLLIIVRSIRVFIIPFLSLSDSAYGPIRLFQVTEIFRTFRVLYAFPDVALMVDGLFAAARSALPILCLLVTSLFCGGVMSSMWVKKDPQMKSLDYDGQTGFLHNHFGTVGWAMLTQLQLATFDTSVILEGAYIASVPFCAFLFLFILVNAFMMLNTLIGFIFDLVAETTQKGTEMKRTAMISQTFEALDKDFSRDISRKEYEESAQPVLRELGVSEEVVDRAFDIIDSNENGVIEKGEFSTYLMKMLRPPNNEELIKLANELNLIEKKIEEIRELKFTGNIKPEHVKSVIRASRNQSVNLSSRTRRSIFHHSDSQKLDSPN